MSFGGFLVSAVAALFVDDDDDDEQYLRLECVR
jgi:hypothetical protein